MTIPNWGCLHHFQDGGLQLKSQGSWMSIQRRLSQVKNMNKIQYIKCTYNLMGRFTISGLVKVNIRSLSDGADYIKWIRLLSRGSVRWSPLSSWMTDLSSVSYAKQILTQLLSSMGRSDGNGPPVHFHSTVIRSYCHPIQLSFNVFSEHDRIPVGDTCQ